MQKKLFVIISVILCIPILFMFIHMIWKSSENKKEVKTPDPVYTIAGGFTEPMKKLSVVNEGNKARLLNKFYKAQQGGTLNAVFIGGSVTRGYYAPSTENYVSLVTQNLKNKFSSVNCINAGIQDTGSYIGVHRLQRDVLSENPDIIFIEFSVNDSAEHSERDKSAFESIIRSSLFNYNAPAVVIIETTSRDGITFEKEHTEIAKVYNLPVLSFGKPMHYAIDKGFIQWSDIAEDYVHPNVTGHKILAGIINDYMNTLIKESKDMTDVYSLPSVPNAVANSKFENADIITPFDIEKKDAEFVYTGAFNALPNSFGGFDSYWILSSSPNGKVNITKEDYFKLQVNAARIGIIYGKVPGGGIFDVKINGNLAAEIDTQGENQLAAEEIYDSADTGYPSTNQRNIEIIPKESGNTQKIYIVSAILYS